MKRLVRSLVNRLGFDITRTGGTWRDCPISRELLSLYDPRDVAVARKVEAFTATSLPRVCSLVAAVRYAVRHGIPGAFVECGVWKGGSSMAVALTLLDENVRDRDLYLFDTFEGMSAPTEKDRSADGTPASAILATTDPADGAGVWCVAGLDEVRANMARTGYPAERIRYVRGKVEDTIPHPDVNEVALLRLDTDWYESTRHEMVHLYPRLADGGVLIIDDYGAWQGARAAVDEYVREHPEFPILLTPLDDTARVAVKVPARRAAKG